MEQNKNQEQKESEQVSRRNKQSFFPQAGLGANTGG